MFIPLVERTGSAVVPPIAKAETVGEKARARTLFGILLRDVTPGPGCPIELWSIAFAC